MQQVKIFKGIENDISDLEKEVNTWIRESGARVVGMTGNIAPQSEAKMAGVGSLTNSAFSPSDLVIIILYETA